MIQELNNQYDDYYNGLLHNKYNPLNNIDKQCIWRKTGNFI